MLERPTPTWPVGVRHGPPPRPWGPPLSCLSAIGVRPRRALRVTPAHGRHGLKFGSLRCAPCRPSCGAATDMGRPGACQHWLMADRDLKWSTNVDESGLSRISLFFRTARTWGRYWAPRCSFLVTPNHTGTKKKIWKDSHQRNMPLAFKKTMRGRGSVRWGRRTRGAGCGWVGGRRGSTFGQRVQRNGGGGSSGARGRRRGTTHSSEGRARVRTAARPSSNAIITSVVLPQF